MVDLREGTGAAGAYQTIPGNVGAFQDTWEERRAGGGGVKPAGRPRVDTNHPDSRGLVLDLPFWERGGDTVEDVSGLGNHGTLENMDLAAAWGISDSGSTLSFDGVNDYCHTNSTPDIVNLESYTIALIVRGDPDAVGTPAVFSQGYSATANSWGVIYKSGADVGFYSRNDGGTAALTVTGRTDVFDGLWHSVVLRRDSATTAFYVDGAYSWHEPSVVMGTWTLDHTTLGAAERVSVANHASSEVASVRAWNRALTPQEIAARYVDPNRHYIRDEE